MKMKVIMKDLRYIYLMVVVLVVSCDILEVEPESQISSENFFLTARDAEAALIASYDALQAFTYARDVVIVSGILSDETRATTGGNFTRHQGFNPNLDQGNIRQLWQQSYNTIHRSLDVLENVPNIDDPSLQMDRVLGEAHFIIGLTYFNLTRYFGKVPIVETTTKSPDQDFLLSRSEVSEVYEVVIRELEEAERLLPAENGNKARATRGAARAILARVYLHRQQAGDYEAALAKCEEVMADDQYQLVTAENYGSIFDVGQQNSIETIFEISYRPELSQEDGSNQFLRELLPTIRYRVQPEDRMLEAITADPDDIRQHIAVDTFENNIYVKKVYLGDITEPITQGPNLIVVRLADVILMQAEALNELGRTTEAVPFLNQIRERAGIAPTNAATQSDVRLAIESERYVELCFEGHRWFDLVRNGRAQDFVPNLTDPDRILWPVPVRELDLNPNLLPQNPSY